MKNVVISNEKGGSGKTSVSIFISIGLLDLYENIKITGVDTDRQKLFYKIMKKRKQNNLSFIDVETDAMKIIDKVENYTNANICICDTPANIDNDTTKTVLENADLVIVPCSANSLDVETTKQYVEWLKKYNINYYVLFTRVDKHKIDFLRKLFINENTFNNVFLNAERYSNLSNFGETDLDKFFSGVWGKYRARDEIEKICDELLEILNK